MTVQDLFLNTDSPVPHQQQFVPFNASWGETNQYGFGGTSLVEVDYASATGIYSPNVLSFKELTALLRGNLLLGGKLDFLGLFSGLLIILER